MGELEDLIPISVATEAARNYATKVVGLRREVANKLVAGDVNRQLGVKGGSVFDSLSCAFTERLGEEFHIDKVGFAKEIIALLAASRVAPKTTIDCDDLERRFRPLLDNLAKRLREARRLEEERRSSNRLARTVAGFLADHPTTTTRERAKVFLEEVEAGVDNSTEGDRVKSLAAVLRRDFGLDENLTEPIERYDEFLDGVKVLRYTERLAKRELRDGRMEGTAQKVPVDSSLPDKMAGVVDENSHDGGGSRSSVSPSAADAPKARKEALRELSGTSSSASHG